MTARRLRPGLAAVLASLVALPASAVTEDEVARFAALADRFDAQLPAPRLDGLGEGQRLRRARCILEAMERAHGGGGVEAALGLMRVLARGAQFDDPTIVAFNDSYGAAYDRAVSRCTAAAGDA